LLFKNLYAAHGSLPKKKKSVKPAPAPSFCFLN